MCRCAISNDFQVEPVVDEYQLLLDKKVTRPLLFRDGRRQAVPGGCDGDAPATDAKASRGPAPRRRRPGMKDIDREAFEPVPFPEVEPGFTFNANFCRNPMCPNFGPAANPDDYADL